MEKRQLGNNGPEVSAIGLGCMGMSEFYGPAGSEDESVTTIARALDLDVNFLDTADMYGLGKNEELVGRAVRGNRERVVLATKFGFVRKRGMVFELDGRPEHARAACEASLRRLGVDAIDLYYLHRVDPKVPIEDTVGAMADLVREGKVRHLGLSEAAPRTLRRACAVHPIAALQTEYSLWSRDPQDEILPVCRELGIGFVAYSPLGRGFLTGRIRSSEDLMEDDWRRKAPRFQGENLEENLGLVERIEELAGDKGCTPAQLALAWVLAQGRDIVPIPGTRRRQYLEENVQALEVELTPDDLHRIEETAPPGTAAGMRYPPDAMQKVDL
ncbi:MAG: aldo/keto reductase [bacterium]